MFKIIFPNATITNYSSVTGTVGAGTLPGASLKVSNLSNRGVSVRDRGTNITEYYIEAYRYAIIPNGDYDLILDSSTMMDYLHPSAQVTITSIVDKLPYSEGELLAATAPLEVLNVSGTVQLSTGQQVSISGPVQLQAGQSVNATIQNATLNSTVTNAMLNTNELIYMGSVAVPVTNLAANGSIYNVDLFNANNMGYYDGIYVVVQSTNGNKYSIQTSYSNYPLIVPPGTISGSAKKSRAQYKVALTNIYSDISFTDTNISSAIGYSTGGSMPFNFIPLVLTNAGTTTIASDSVTVYYYAIRGTVQVSNQTSSPVPTQMQYQSTTTALGNYNVSLPAPAAIGAIGTKVYTGSINVSNIKRMAVYLTLTNALNLTPSGSGPVVYVQLYGSYDGSNFYAVDGTSSIPNIATIDSNTASQSVWDSSVSPQMVAGYNYLEFAVYIKNTSNSTQTVSSASATVGITVITQQ